MTPAAPRISVVSPVYCCAGCLHELCRAPSRHAVLDRRAVRDHLRRRREPGRRVARRCASSAPPMRTSRRSRCRATSASTTRSRPASSTRAATGSSCSTAICRTGPEEIANSIREGARRSRRRVRRARDARRQLAQAQSSRAFIALLNYLSGADYDYRTANFGIYRRAVIDAVRSMGDQSRFFPGHGALDRTSTRRRSRSEHDARSDGSSSYTLRKLARLALEIVLSHSDKPLRLVAALGIFVSLIALAMTGFSVLRYLRGDVTVAGYTSVIASDVAARGRSRCSAWASSGSMSGACSRA